MKPSAKKTKEFILQQDTHEERWWMTVQDRQHPEGTTGNDEFVAHPSDESGPTELGIIVYRDGRVSNRWGDGTVGVPDFWVKLAAEEEDLFDFRTGEADGGWYDVLADSESNFVDWASE